MDEEARKQAARARLQARMNKRASSGAEADRAASSTGNPQRSQAVGAAQAKPSAQASTSGQLESNPRNRADQTDVAQGAQGTGRAAQSRAQSDPGAQRGAKQAANKKGSGKKNASAASRPTDARAKSTATAKKAKPGNSQTTSKLSSEYLQSIIPPRMLYIILGAIVLALLIFAVIIPRCSAQTSGEGSEEASLPSAESVEPSEDATPVNSDGATPRTDALNAILGEETADKLIAQAETNADALWIASHPEEYAFEGSTVQWKILKLAADEPAALPYVREFPSKYPAETQTLDADLAMSEEDYENTVFKTDTPHLYQWDRRWAQTEYSATTFGLTGCGPTSFAMVVQGLTDNEVTPYEMAVYAQEHGYMSQYDGTSVQLFYNEAEAFGLSCRDMAFDSSNIRGALESGQLIIANLGPGYFTRTGHFFVLTGVAEDGRVIINDPYSKERSTQLWDVDLIISESQGLYAFSKL